jgi:uncharacterized LabA/DUF88 family protein
MATLIAVDGHSLNLGLQRVAQDRNRNHGQSHSRFRIDHGELAEFLTRLSTTHLENEEDLSLNFYTDNEKSDGTSKVMGRVVKYFSTKGYGFISATDSNSYFFHNNDVINKRALCEGREDRYPHPTSHEFQKRIVGKVVTFEPATSEDDKTRAEEVRIELGTRSLDQFYRLRREPFLEMLADHGYQIIRCKPSYHSGKAKSIDVKICIDASWDLEEDDTFILLSDDPIFSELVTRLLDADINVILATFETSNSEKLRNIISEKGGKVVLLDEHLDELELEFENDDMPEDTDDADFENSEAMKREVSFQGV